MEAIFREQDNGRTVEVPVGEQFSLELNENPTTGFRWSQPQIDGNGVALQSDNLIPTAAAGVGSGGVRRFVFDVTSATTATVRLVHQRSWQADRSVAAPFELTIRGTS